MKKLSIFLSAISCIFIWFSFAAQTVLNPSYTVNWNDVKIYWTDNSNGWYMDINLQDPETKDWLHFGEVKMSDQTFTYTKQWDWDQNVRMIPWDGWDQIRFTIESSKSSSATTKTDTPKEEQTTATRTVIPATPKTGPSWNIIWIILATLAIFGWYIYIKRKADI